jgi:hypothetical protein
MDANLHDLIHAFTEIKRLEIDEARIRMRKRRLFCHVSKVIDDMALKNATTNTTPFGDPVS